MQASPRQGVAKKKASPRNKASPREGVAKVEGVAKAKCHKSKAITVSLPDTHG